MKTGQAGLNLIKQYEGCKLNAYKCPAGVWTIGYGHTSGVTAGQKITQAQADAYLIADVAKFETNVNKYYDKYKWNQNEFDALVSFAFNIGSIDQLTANGTRERTVIAEKFLLYNKAAGKVLSGLTKRRAAERELFLSKMSCDVATNVVCVAASYPTLRKGSTGEYVEQLQKRLNERGYSLSCDGIFGTKTLEAVKAFQKDNGLDVDGIVGKKTWDKFY